MTDRSQTPMSVVVTIIDGGQTLHRCLRALGSQTGAPPLEVLVPYDSTVSGMEEFADLYPEYSFVDIGTHTTKRDPASLAGQHELFDIRRAHGLRLATGQFVGMLEDRGVPRLDWASSMLAAHRQGKKAVGGAVECGRDKILNWAVYFCDFGRYQLPVQQGRAEYITDVNLSYQRSVLNMHCEHWEERYHETTLHWSMQRDGIELWLTPTVVIDHIRDHLSLVSLIEERFYWARLFAYTRVMDVSMAKRFLYAAISPILPFALFLRLVRQRLTKKRSLGPFIKAAPATFLLLCCWCLGEFVGYLTGTE